MATVAKPQITIRALLAALWRGLKTNTLWAMIAGGAAAMLIRYLQDPSSINYI